MIRARKGQADKEKEATKPATAQPSSLEQLRKHRITRVRRQNEKLALELRKAKGELVPREGLVREVLACNAVVKQQILSAPIRVGPGLGLTGEQIKGLSQELVNICNDLAFDRERPPETCPCCGRGMQEEDKAL
jgi:hypothetical protein